MTDKHDEMTFTALKDDRHAAMGIIMQVAHLSPKLSAQRLGDFYNTVLPSTITGNFILMLEQKVPVGFATWGMFNTVSAAKFRCYSNGLSAQDTVSGKVPYLISLAAPFTPEHEVRLREYLLKRFTDPKMRLYDGEQEIFLG